MSQNTVILLSLLCVFLLVLLVLVVALLMLLWKSQQTSQRTMKELLVDQQVENQSLRNQLRSVNPEHLASLNYVTLPSSKVVHQGSDPVDVDDMAEAINYEELMARKGYETGELGYDLESAGWAPAVFRRSSDGDPIAYDSGS